MSIHTAKVLLTPGWQPHQQSGARKGGPRHCGLWLRNRRNKFARRHLLGFRRVQTTTALRRRSRWPSGHSSESPAGKLLSIEIAQPLAGETLLVSSVETLGEVEQRTSGGTLIAPDHSTNQRSGREEKEMTRPFPPNPLARLPSDVVITSRFQRSFTGGGR